MYICFSTKVTNDHFNNQHFGFSLETKQKTTGFE